MIKEINYKKKFNIDNFPSVLVEFLITVLGFIPILITVGIVGIFLYETWAFFQVVSVGEFLGSREWTPNFSDPQFGIIVLLSGTFLVTIIALLVAIPVGILGAIYLSEFAPKNVRRFLKIAMESLGGIPGVVYGYFALLFLTPLLRNSLFPNMGGFNALSAGICVGILIIPIISSLTEDALSGISDDLRNSAYALGFTRFEMIYKVLLPLTYPAILSSFTLATSVALGETMVVAIASGQRPNLTLNPLQPIETITSFIIKVSLGSVQFDSILFKTIFTLGFILFLVTFTLNTISYWLQNKSEKQLFSFSTSVNKLAKKELINVNQETNVIPAFYSSGGNSYQPLLRESLSAPGLKAPINNVRLWCDRTFTILAFLGAIFGVVFIAILLWNLSQTGLEKINWAFLTSFASRRAEESGILSALVGSLWLFILTLVMVIPLGVGSAIYLEEYRKNKRIDNILEISIANLASIPSILYGLLGLQIFVRWMRPITGGPSILSGALVLTVMSLPTLIIASRSAIKSSSKRLKNGGYALGMSKQQVLRKLILPSALPGILTGVLLSQTRALAETAALIGVGVAASVRFLPPLSWQGLQSSYTTLPVQIFNWLQNPSAQVQQLAAAATIVLVVILIILNLFSVLIREYFNNLQRN
ncbi:phosphate ABC transporter permease subunit PstC [Cyanobacterium stanieri LEGE 03274]|uniref:Phosphate ABC transporter permease subunit PstC n=1 Tax=Cyanobacterium stanieri LEGE 03274 TaxID=1828756 RepID=A0ABR9V3K5_9CHRO|nr:phosphate ABC transporter permease subunit PstC [Cyanobacterium stanieri]MBE9222467.1 phosphate ABC transporter permease subunit PstC [Cyanobacterium stanieri LEGE 03274]